jgi:SAM-dependent methyltransferase
MEPGHYAEMRHAEDHHWWYLGMREATKQILLAHGLDAASCRWLDAGCGTGGNLAAMGGQFSVGLDASPLALDLCAKRGAIMPVLGSVEALPFASEQFELVTSFEVLYHRAVTSDLTALSEIRRILRPNGVLLLRLPAYDWLRGGHDVIVHTARRYTVSRVERLTQRAGLVPVYAGYLNCMMLLPAIAMRVVHRFLRVATTDDLAQPIALVNSLLSAIIAREGRWLAQGRHLPCGLSVLAIARRPGV